jgi:hypothetical protein
MASYLQPDEFTSVVFNESDYLTTAKELANVGVDKNYVRRDGDTMTGSLHVPSLTTSQLAFPGSTQTQAFTDVLQELLQTVNTRTQHIWVNGDNNTEISTVCVNTLKFIDDSNQTQTKAFSDTDRSLIEINTNKLTKVTYDANLLKTSVSGSLYASTFSCGNFNTSYLTTLSSDVESRITSALSKTQHQSATTLPGNTKLTQFDGTIKCDKIQMGYSEQVSAFTESHKNKLSWLNIDASQLIVNKLTFLDGTQQTSAYTTSDKSKLSTLDSTMNSVYQQVLDLDEKVSLPMTNVYNSQMYTFDVDLGLPYTGSNFYTSQTTVTLGNVSPGVVIIQGIVYANRVNSLTKFVAKFQLSTGAESEGVGWQFEASNTTWFYIRLPMMWIVSSQNGGTLSLYMDYSYRPNSDTRFSFKGNMIQFK